jgi:hypothetical protein
LTREDGAGTLARNIGKQLPHDAAKYPRRAQISSTSWRKPEIKIIKFALSEYFQYICNSEQDKEMLAVCLIKQQFFPKILVKTNVKPNWTIFS